MHLSWKRLCLCFVYLSLTSSLRLYPTQVPAIDNDTDWNRHRLVACSQPKAPGLCRGRQLRYAYNGITDNCESFYYTGCASTENNFLTYEECRRDCMHRLRY